MDSEKSHGWTEGTGIELPNMPGARVRVFTKEQCRVLVGHEDRKRGGPKLWHLSISHPKRYPTWDEIKDARYSLLPLGVTFAMLLPPQSEYVNIHHNCFHLFELPEGAP